MSSSVVIGCLVAVACFVAVDSRALSSVEVKANQANPAESAQQVNFQQADEAKPEKEKKGILYKKYFLQPRIWCQSYMYRWSGFGLPVKRNVFSRAWHWLHVFPRLALVTCFPALGDGRMFSRAWCWLHDLIGLSRYFGIGQ